MKFKEGVILTKNGDEHIMVAAGEAAKSFNGMINLNGTAAFIAEQLQHETTKEDLITAVCDKYDVTPYKAESGVTSVIEQLLSIGLIQL